MAEKKTTKPAAEETVKKPAAKKTTEEKPAAKKPAAEKKAEPKKAAEKKPAAKKEAGPKAKKEEVKPAAQEVEDLDDEVVELISEDGESKKFYHVATIDYENEWYVFFQPAEKMEDTDEDEVVVFHLDSDENDNDIFLPVQSEELLHKVYAEYVRLMEEHEGCGHDHDHDHDHEHGGCAPSACAGCHNKCK